MTGTVKPGFGSSKLDDATYNRAARCTFTTRRITCPSVYRLSSRNRTASAQSLLSSTCTLSTACMSKRSISVTAPPLCPLLLSIRRVFLARSVPSCRVLVLIEFRFRSQTEIRTNTHWRPMLALLSSCSLIAKGSSAAYSNHLAIGGVRQICQLHGLRARVCFAALSKQRVA